MQYVPAGDDVREDVERVHDDRNRERGRVIDPVGAESNHAAGLEYAQAAGRGRDHERQRSRDEQQQAGVVAEPQVERRDDAPIGGSEHQPRHHRQRERGNCQAWPMERAQALHEIGRGGVDALSGDAEPHQRSEDEAHRPRSEAIDHEHRDRDEESEHEPKHGGSP